MVKNKSIISIMIFISTLLLLVSCGNINSYSNNTINSPISSPKETIEVSKDIFPIANSDSILPLHVEGTKLKNTNDEIVQLRGISTHGIAWFPQYINYDCFSFFKTDFHINVIRLSMYTAEYQGYCTDGNKDKLFELICNGIEYANELNLYVIVDWHILSDNDPLIYKEESKLFFDKLSEKYKDYSNIIYEICNEPNSGTSWSNIKDYADEIIPIIRSNNTDAIIIVGTPNWSQYVDEVAKSPLDYDNVLYSLHFYADTHKNDLRKKTKNALNANIPIFVSEFGICDASGNGNNNILEADKWIQLLDENSISYCMWNLSNKAESSAMIKATCIKTNKFTNDDLTESALWLKNTLLHYN